VTEEARMGLNERGEEKETKLLTNILIRIDELFQN
jgi:hypothetical protein